MRTIRVTGKGQLKVHPDMTRITMELKGVSWEYGETLEKSAKETEQMKDILAPFGFDRTDLKTLRFDVETLYESYQEKKVWKERFNGYQYTHVMKVEFESDNQRLGKVLYALASTPNGDIISVREKLNMNSNQFTPYRTRLIRKGIINGEIHGTIYFELPLFDEFVLQNYDPEEMI